MSLAFPDTSTIATDTKIIRERRQEVDGKTFVVCSIFDRSAGKSAGDKLLTLVESDCEKSSPKTV
jgi:hypothetical protein